MTKVRATIEWYEIRVTDVSAGLAFYTAVFDVAPAPWEEERFTMLVDPAGTPRFALEQVETAPPTATWLSPTWDTDDLEATLRAVEDAGGSVHLPRTEIGGGFGWWAAAHDPFGNPLHFSTSAPAG